MSEQVLTNFPTTYYELAGDRADSTSDPNALKFDASDICTYFNNLQARSSSQIAKAHTLIMDECYSPYEAWLHALNINTEYVIYFMEMNRETAEFYFKNPQYSPPADQVYSFCEKLKIHPAYLQPGLAEQDYSYHSSVLNVIIDMAEDRDTLPVDRALCIEALEAERDRLMARNREPRHHKGIEYLGRSLSLHQTMDMTIVKQNGEEEIRKYDLSLEAPDVVTHLDNLRGHLARAAKNADTETAMDAVMELEEFEKWCVDIHTNEFIIPAIENLRLIQSFMQREQMRKAQHLLPDFSVHPE